MALPGLRVRSLAVGRVVTGAGPAVDGTRGGFLAVLGDLSVATVVVEHRDPVGPVRRRVR
jgi:hypothetical protein